MSDDTAESVNGQKTAAPEKARPNWLSRLLWMGPRVAEARAKTLGPGKPGFVWFDIARQLSDDTPEIGETGKCSLAGILLDCAQVGLLVRATLEREGMPSDPGSQLNTAYWANAFKLPVIAEAFARLTDPQRSMLTAMLGPDQDATLLAKLTGQDQGSFARAVRRLVISLSEPLAFEAGRLGRALFVRWSRLIVVTLALAVPLGVAVDRLDKKLGKPNIALHCPVTVSSQYPTDGTDHSLLVDGDTDNLGFHTKSDGQQWVVIDLGSVRKFDEVVVYNRSGFQDRAVPLRLEISNDNVHFTPLRERKETFDKWTASDLHAEGRYVRLLNPPSTFFHLAEVQIF